MVTPVAPKRYVPVIITVLPEPAEDGVKEVIVGAIAGITVDRLKLVALLPLALYAVTV